jgi:hypothetical protein
MIDTPAKPAAPGAAETPVEAAYPARKAWWIVGGTLTAAALLTGLAAYGSWAWIVSSTEESDTRTQEFDRPVDTADVTADIGDVVFEATEGAGLDYRLKTRWLGAEPDTSEDWDGDVFTAVGECGQSDFLGLDVDQCQTNYTLGLPSGADAAAETGVGDITFDGLDGEIDAQSGVGDVFGEHLRTTSTTVETGVGDVSLGFDEVRGDITVDAGTGDVLIIVPDDGTTYAVSYDGAIGDRNIQIATDPGADADYAITVSGVVGSLTVQYGI